MLYLLLATTLLFVTASPTFHWPDPRIHDLEEALYAGSGIFASFTIGCVSRDNTTVAAQWLRLAYHDMATHNVDDGTGGLDASILYETERTQNVGIGMNESLNEISAFTTPYAGLADMIAMGAVFAVASCGGPIVPFRGGRVDATKAGPETVPLPQDSLASHIESFRRQGFNETEMIALVACGHSLGGVRQVDFPTVVPEDAPNGFANFTPTGGFDNTLVTQYLEGSTEDPLVVGTNTTTNSDLRIFSSDGNKTMNSLAKEANFQQTCGALLARMLDTVPKSVTLTEPVELIEHKVLGVSFYPSDEGSVILTSDLRFTKENANRNVTLFWKERTGNSCGTGGCTVQPFLIISQTPTFLAELLGVENFAHYIFNTTINASTSISKFWFQVDEKDGSEPYTIDNLGTDYIIEQDTVLYDALRTQFIINESDPDNTFLSFRVAVKTEVAGLANVSIETYQANFPLPIIDSIQLQPDPNTPPASGYSFFMGNSSASTGLPSQIIVNADIHGTRYQLYVEEDYFVVPSL